MGAVGTTNTAPGLPQSPRAATPVPGGVKLCGACHTDNAANMRFCRHCGSPLQNHASPPAPAVPQAAMSQAPTAPAQQPVVGNRTMVAPAPVPTPAHGSGRQRAAPTPPPRVGSAPQLDRKPQRCASCGGDTPAGFSFCQRCGRPLTPAVSTPAPTTPSARIADGVPRPSQTPTPRSVKIPATDAPPWAALISVKRDGSDGTSHVLKGDYIELGSASSAELCFDDDYLAPVHARIERQGSGGARLVPLDRTNGVFRRIREDTTLTDGSVILIGRELLRFELLAESERRAVPLTQHGVKLFGSPERESWGRLVQLLATGAARDLRHLNGAEMIIGREEGDIVFSDDEFLSRRHAALRFVQGQCVLSDLGSSNGTFVRLRGPVNLSVGDFLRIGDQMFRFKPEA